MNIKNIAFQNELSYLIPEIPDHKDYAEFKYLIERIDEILKLTRLDLDFAVTHLTINCLAKKTLLLII